jgi:uncharacterized protein DUF3592
MTGPTFGAVIFALAGGGLIILGLVLLFQIRQTRRVGIHTQGTVVGNDETRDVDNSRQVSPRIRFITEDGRTVEFEPRVSLPFSVYEQGEQVPVVYQRSRPEKAIVDTFLFSWLMPTVALALGLICSYFAAMFLLAGTAS